MAEGNSEIVGFSLSNIILSVQPPDCSSKETDQLISTNLNVKKSGTALFQCESVENLETHSHCATIVAKQEVNDVDSNGPSALSEIDKPQQNSRKLFECDVCNMKFSNGANMRRHKMRHTGVKPYECRVCQKRFFRKDHLAEHFTTHTKTLPYHCPICNRGFQRQIAMRAHFQNEHVGQHDLVKTCPLCSYRAGTMKSLRVHFFNRHGIDLDNPGSAPPNSLLLALDPQSSGQFHQTLSSTSIAVTPSYSDSGESLRSTDNVTPPMHFLTPHVEISMSENHEQPNMDIKKLNDNKPASTSNDSIFSSHLSNSPKLPLPKNAHNKNTVEGHITPSISLIPIKQETIGNEDSSDQKSSSVFTTVNSFPEATTPVTNLTSLIKVSPLKSLLREDLKRRICARANNRAARNLQNGNNAFTTSVNDPNLSNGTTTVNGMYTSSGHEVDLSPSNRKIVLQCLFCRIEFPDQTLYFLHKGCHSDSNPWKCNICGEQCNNVYEFNSHLLSKSHQ